MRELETRLGVRLLTRTTRSVSPTEAGERLLHTLGPRFEEIDAELAALSEFREKPAGTIRITATDYAVDTILWPKIAKFLRQYPDIKVTPALAGFGLAYVPEDVAQPHLAKGSAATMLPTNAAPTPTRSASKPRVGMPKPSATSDPNFALP